jgi:hypothetical protein
MKRFSSVAPTNNKMSGTLGAPSVANPLAELGDNGRMSNRSRTTESLVLTNAARHYCLNLTKSGESEAPHFVKTLSGTSFTRAYRRTIRSVQAGSLWVPNDAQIGAQCAVADSKGNQQPGANSRKSLFVRLQTNRSPIQTSHFRGE